MVECALCCLKANLRIDVGMQLGVLNHRFEPRQELVPGPLQLLKPSIRNMQGPLADPILSPALKRGYVAFVIDSLAQLFLAREAGLFLVSFCE
jgi:hypothetical protein